MSARFSPIVSEFETEEQATRYDKWFRTQVQASINDPAPNATRSGHGRDAGAFKVEAARSHRL